MSWLKLTQKKKEKAGIKAESKPNPANKNKKLDRTRCFIIIFYNMHGKSAFK